MLPAKFEPATPASERPQAHALHRAATGIGKNRTRDLPVCSAVPQPTALPRTPSSAGYQGKESEPLDMSQLLN